MKAPPGNTQAQHAHEQKQEKEEQQNTTNSALSGFDFVNESDSFSFIAETMSTEGQRAQEAASLHRQQILENYMRPK